MNTAIKDAIRKSAAVPSIPQVVVRFLEVIQDPNFDYDDVAKVLGADAGTVAELLRLSNSALFGVARKVSSLKQALTLLGPRRTRSLILGRYLVEAVENAGTGAIDRNYFWRRSLATAVVGSRLADEVAPRLRDEVFLCGLLADIGLSILAQALPEQYASIVNSYAPHGVPASSDAERAAVDTTHAEVSALVLADWSIPAEMCDAVRLSHDYTVQADSAAGQIARIINASDRIGRLLCEIPDVDGTVSICTEATAFVGVDIDYLSDVLDAVESDIEELATILKVDVIPSAVYLKIAECIRERVSTSAAH